MAPKRVEPPSRALAVPASRQDGQRPEAEHSKTHRAQVEEQGDEEEQVPLTEDVEPEPDGTPAYTISDKWHPNRVRMWLAIWCMGLFCLMLIGLLVLILNRANEQQLLVWVGATASVSTLASGVVGYYFGKKN